MQKELIQPENVRKKTHKQDDFDTKLKDLTDFYSYFRTSKKLWNTLWKVLTLMKFAY